MPSTSSGGTPLLSSQFGILMHVLGSFLIVYGQTIVKVSHLIAETSKDGVSWRRPDGTIRPVIYAAGSKLYAVTGWALFAIGNLLRFVSMRYGSQTVLSGLSSLQFIVIPMASYHLLGVTSDTSTYVGIGILLVGNVLILMHGPGNDAVFTIDQLRAQWFKASVKQFLFGIGFVMASMHILWRLVHHRRREAEAKVRVEQKKALRRKRSLSGSGSFGSLDGLDSSVGDSIRLSPTGTGLGLGTGERGDLATIAHDPSVARMFAAAVLFSAVSAFVGAWSVLFSKSLTYIFGDLFGGDAAGAVLWDGYTWLVVGAFVLSAGFWVRQTNKGLKLYPATLIMPLLQAFWLAMSILQGAIYFDETQGLSSRELTWLVVGLVLAIAGALLMVGVEMRRVSSSARPD